MGLLDGWRNYRAVRNFKKSPLGQALQAVTQEYFYGGSALSSLSEDFKRRQIDGLAHQLSTALQSDDPRMALRENLMDYVYQYAQLQVLCLTEEEKAQAFYADNPYITGELHYHIENAAEHVDELARYKWEEQADREDLIDFANGRCTIYLYYMNSTNVARMHLGDQTDPDWFRPFVESQLVWLENTARKALGLPLTVKDSFEALAYSSFFNRVEEGAINPFYEWCKTWPELYLAGRGPVPTHEKV